MRFSVQSSGSNWEQSLSGSCSASPPEELLLDELLLDELLLEELLLEELLLEELLLEELLLEELPLEYSSSALQSSMTSSAEAGKLATASAANNSNNTGTIAILERHCD